MLANKKCGFCSIDIYKKRLFQYKVVDDNQENDRRKRESRGEDR